MNTVPDRVVRALKKRIVRGELGPGARLPDRRTLARTFGVSPVTIQLAVTRLVDEGFATVGARKHGTVVAEKPPHLHHYKLLFPYDPTYRGEFWRVLREEARRMTEETDRDFSFFYGQGGHRDRESYEELVEDVRAERVAGLIFASGAAEFKGTPILDQPGIPRVAIADEYELPGMPKLTHEYGSFFRRAVDLLVARGRRRIAVLFGATANDGAKTPVVKELTACMAERGLSVNPLWMQFVHIWSEMSACRCLHLMLHEGQRVRPDGLILADDNFIAPATRGIVEAGVRVPDELSAVALVNFPSRIEAAVPVSRIGFDVHEFLEAAATTIDDLRKGREVREVQRINVIGEDEYCRRIRCSEGVPSLGR